jgi:putative membrane protein
MKKYILLLLMIGILLPTMSCSNEGQDIISSNDRTFIQQAFERNLMDMQSSQIVRTRSTNNGLIRYAELLIQKGNETSDELLRLAGERNIQLAAELSPTIQSKATNLVNIPVSEFNATYLTSIIQSRKIALELYRQQIKNGSDNALREWASGKISQLTKDMENAENLMDQTEIFQP